MRIVFGLGNPGERYRFTRHNVGFLLADYIAEQQKIPFRPGKGDYYFTEYFCAGERVLLVKPATFMNRSGWAVKQALETFSAEEKDILVVYDDFHLTWGTLRFRAKGSAGGHNGLKSIIYHTGSDLFNRLKIGIGSTFDNSVDFVLSRFSDREVKDLELLLDAAAKGVTTWVEEGIDQAMNGYNRNFLDTENSK